MLDLAIAAVSAVSCPEYAKTSVNSRITGDFKGMDLLIGFHSAVERLSASLWH